MTRDALRRMVVDRGVLVSAVTLVLYVLLAPHHVVDGDNAEFATLSVTGGAAHPSGYPVYVLWLRLTSWLPGTSPAHTAAISTAILGGASVLALHAACRAWGARPLAATIAVAIFGTGPVVLRVVTEAEVFALNNLVVAIVLWLAADAGPLRGARRAFALGLVAGLGLSNHLTCALVAPVGILGVVRGMREGRAAISALVAVAGLALGLLPYTYLLIASDTPHAWGAVRDLDTLVGMVLRRDYGGPTAFRPGEQDFGAATNLLALAKTLGRAWLWLPGLAGLGLLAVRIARPGQQSRAGWITLATAWLLAGPMLALRFNVPPEGIGLYVCQRFHMLPALLLAIPVAHVLDLWTPKRAAAWATIVGSVGVVLLVAPSLSYLGRVHSPAVEVGAKNLLHSLPPDAVLIHGQDELHSVPAYVQWALGDRQDVRIVTWPMMTLGWYRERVAARGVVSGPGAGTPEVRLVGALLERGVPVFVDRLQRDVMKAFPTYPYGVVLRVLPRGASVPDIREVLAINEALFARFALDYPTPGPDDEFATEVHLRYAVTWTMIGKMLEHSGAPDEAAAAFERARVLGPR